MKLDELEKPENKITDFYIGQTNASGIKAKSKKEFFEYLSDLITDAEENGKTTFDITIED